MTANLRKPWYVALRALSNPRNRRRAVRAAMLGAGLFSLVGCAVATGFSPYVDAAGKIQPGKTLWDWLELLIIPIVLALGAFWLQRSEWENDRRLAQQRRLDDQEKLKDQQQETALQSYIDRMTGLLLDEKRPLRASAPGDEARIVARTLTLAASRTLDPVRKGLLLKFLYEAKLITLEASKRAGDGEEKQVDWLSVIDLKDADLNGANLRGADLRGANLRSVNLSGAYMINASLSGAALSNANLHGANLISANLSSANLSGADLRKAELRGTDLSEAYLREANLREAALNGAKLPNANLSEADLSKAVLRDANLSSANLRRANLRGADLTSANLRGAILIGADWRDTNAHEAHLENAVQPDGNPYIPPAPIPIIEVPASQAAAVKK